jgi:RHS repeat-associated protein
MTPLAGASVLVTDASSASAHLSGALVVPGSPLEVEQREAEELARRNSPEAVAARAESVSAFERLDTVQAAKLAGEAFPAAINRREGGPPALVAGQRITGYVTPNIADLETRNRQHGLIESTAPMATRSATGWSPVNLSLRATGGGFAATNPLLMLRIPKRASDGIELPERAVSITPVDATTGSSLGGSEGVLDGASVLYANTQTDTDTAVKPLTSGLEATSILRSALSPQQLAFRISIPRGASLEQKRGSAVQIVKQGQVIASIPAPDALDAEGVPVPVRTSISGNTLMLTVDHRSAGYRYPIAVDPRLTDTAILLGRPQSNWGYASDDPKVFHEGEGFDEAKDPTITYVEGSSYVPGEYAYFVYHTQGFSHIDAFAVAATTRDYNFEGGIAVGNSISVASPLSGNEGTVALSTWSPSPDEEQVVCTSGSCETRPINPKTDENRAYFEVHTLESRHEYFFAEMLRASVYITQEKAPTASLDTSDATLNGQPNASNGQWVSTKSTSPAVLGVSAEDQGVGVNAIGAKSPNKSGWGFAPRETSEAECAGVQCNECDKGECPGLVMKHGKPLSPSFGSLGELPDGEDTVEATVQDAAGLAATATGKINVDNTAPHGLVLTGLPTGNEIGEGSYTVKAEATDGAGSIHSSGVKSLAVAIDGREVGKPAGSCPSGLACTAKGEWTLAGSGAGVGEHKLTLTATDNAGNVAVETYALKVHHAAPLELGPGDVNTQSGEFGVTASDVSIGAPGSDLTVGRSYRSRHITGSGPLGPQWSLSVGGQEGIITWLGSPTLETAAGGEITFTSSGGGKFTAPPGDANLALTEVKNGNGVTTEYLLRDASDAVTTHFTPSGFLWKPTRQEGALASETMRYVYQTVEGVTEPTYALAPEPAGLGYSCIAKLEKAESLEKGCRALSFKYASSTTATGENQSEWNAYKGRLEEISLIAYNPATKAMASMHIAQYAYDSKGRLRAEWDPRISPALKTIYGYDQEGHLTALTPPGQESWAFIYGTSGSDTSPGRLVKVTRSPASAPLWNGLAVTNTEAPKITGSPLLKTRLAVSNGSWSNAPITYGYQWQDCNSAGAECSPIPGATNPNYTVATSDAGHTILAQVTASNGGGSVVASALTALITSVPVPVFSSRFEVPGGSTAFKPQTLARDTHGKLWAGSFSLSGNLPKGKTEVFNEAGALQFSSTVEAGAPAWPSAAIDAEGHIWTSTLKGKVLERNESGTVLKEIGALGTGAAQITQQVVGLAISPTAGNLYIVDRGANRIEEFTPAGSFLRAFGWGVSDGASRFEICTTTCQVGIAGSGNGQFSNPSSVAIGTGGTVWVSDSSNNRIQAFSEAGEYRRQVGGLGSAPGQFNTPNGIAAGPQETLWVVDMGNHRVQVLNEAGEYQTQFGSSSNFAEVTGIAVSSSWEVWLADTAGGQPSYLEKWSAPAATEGSQLNPSAGSTIEYGIPTSGTGLPTLTATETAKWGQTDTPVEGVAIFPPDEPMGWPAKDYRRATVSYWDVHGNAVNTVAPGGGVTTSEFNATHDVVRTLSADNRAIVLKESCESKEKCKSAELAKLIDSENTYNEGGSEPGTELLSTLGPRHTIGLPNHTQAEARIHTVYSYNEGQPTEGGPYHLVTKTTQGAQISGKEEPETVRTVTTSYGGQEGLGWKLRKATSVTDDPSGLNLTHTTVYDPATGNVVETKTPAGSKGGSGSSGPPVYISQFGSQGNKEGQFETPEGVAVDPTSGNVYVADYALNRVEKFTASGVFVSWVGSATSGSGEGQLSHPESVAVSSSGNVYVGDAGNHRVEEFNAEGKYVRAFGKEGTGEGQFGSTIYGLAFDSSGKLWASDGANHRVEKFSETGVFEKKYGEKGSGEGQLEEPRGITVSAGNVYVVDTVNDRVVELSTEAKFVSQFGKYGLENGQLREPWGIAADAKGNLYVADRWADRLEEFSPTGSFVAWLGSFGAGEGLFNDPDGLASDATGDLYVADQGNHRIQKWRATTGNAEAHDTQTVYYSTAANSKYPGCGEHPEWANQPCLSQPAAQPETGGLPKLPVTERNSYNLWDEPELTTERVGTVTRTVTATYDAGGRLKATTASSTEGVAMPTISYGYTAETGAETGVLTTKSTTVEGKTQKITSVFNTLRELTAYTDADSNTSTYEYDIDGRTKKINDGKGSQTYTYGETLGLLSELVDSSSEGMKFTASYDAEGKLLTEGYPNGMTASYVYNPAGTATGLEYKKITHCTEKCTWFSDSVVPSSHGQWLEQSSTLSHQAYTYDANGRLTQVQSTPSGKGCSTRLYHYDEDTNETSMTTREPGTEGKCATEGGTIEAHIYDEADRLIDSGVGYNAFGDTTALPPSDAGGFALTSNYYVDNQLQSQTQNGETIGYNLDPAGRTRETVSTGKTSSTVVSHYSDTTTVPAWTVNTSSQATRYILGIDGQLAAIQKGLEAPVLQITNLHGDIVATASNSETATELASKVDTTEFGVPTTSSPPPYSWLGGDEISAELPSGVIAMGARSYVPQLGRFLQPDPIAGGSANAYSYTFGDPVNTADPSGEYTITIDAFDERYEGEQAAAAAAARAAEILAAEEAAARAAAEANAAQVAREAELARILGEGAGAIVGGGGGRLFSGNPFANLESHASDCWYGAFHRMNCHPPPPPKEKGRKYPRPDDPELQEEERGRPDPEDEPRVGHMPPERPEGSWGWERPRED